MTTSGLIGPLPLATNSAGRFCSPAAGKIKRIDGQYFRLLKYNGGELLKNLIGDAGSDFAAHDHKDVERPLICGRSFPRPSAGE